MFDIKLTVCNIVPPKIPFSAMAEPILARGGQIKSSNSNRLAEISGYYMNKSEISLDLCYLTSAVNQFC